MKFRCLLLILLLGNCVVFAQIRDSVCIVSPQYNTETTEFVEAVSEKLNESGYRDLSKRISGRLDSIFGSGVVVMGANKTRYVLTNQHVVSLADSVTIEFRNTNGESETFENCPVFAVNEQLDLALVLLPETASRHPALEISRRTIRDGDEVWSAGYPGLSGEPSWQFGKGTITNEAARVPDLIDPELSVIYQHSAPVDPGNSGGPLLQPIPGQDGRYTIAGINTWKVFFRQAANFAVPAKTIETFLQRATSGENLSMKDLIKKSESFLANITRPSTSDEEEVRYLRNLGRYLSLDAIKNRTMDDLLPALGKAPTHIRNEIIQNLAYSSIFDGMRLAIAWNLVKQLPDTANETAIIPVTPIDSMKPAETVTVTYSADSQNILSVSWQYTTRNWNIYSLETVETGSSTQKPDTKDAEKKTGTSTFSIEKPYSFQILGEVSFRNEVPFIGVNYGFVGRFFAAGGGFAVGILEETEEESFGLLDNKILQIFGFLKAQVPMNFTSFCIIPYAAGRVGMSLMPGDTEDSGFKIIPVTGVDFVFKTTVPLVIGCGWVFDLEASQEDYSGPLISIGLGL